jgi:hypothetical protein
MHPVGGPGRPTPVNFSLTAMMFGAPAAKAALAFGHSGWDSSFISGGLSPGEKDEARHFANFKTTSR